MPLLRVGRIVLSNLTYTAVCVILLSTSFYYAAQAASNSSADIFISTDLITTENTYDGFSPPSSGKSFQNDTLTSQVKQVAKILVQDSFGVWSMINMAYCCILLLGAFIQKVLFGELRPSEQQHIKNKFWTFVFYKFIFVFGIINVQYVHEVIFWCAWFSILGFLNLLTQLGKDRFEYLTFSLPSSNWGLLRLLGLLAGVFLLTGFMLLISVIVGVFAGFNIFAFMAAECILLNLRTVHVLLKYIIYLYDIYSGNQNIVLNWEKRGPVTYYTELSFELCILILDFLHHIHMLLWSNMFLSIASLVVCMQLRQLFYEIRKRVKRHQNYLWVARHLEKNYPMVTPEKMSAHDDNCAICWEAMNRARKLPCGHMFHNSCLQSWLEQDSSCPTCRTTLNNGIRYFGTPSANADHSMDHNLDNLPISGRSPYHFFHFDGSRYISWLPSFSVEVTHYQLDTHSPIQTHQIDSIAVDVQQLFPSVPVGLIAEDLRMSRSIELTIENILEGRVNVPRVENDQDNVEDSNEERLESNLQFQADTLRSSSSNTERETLDEDIQENERDILNECSVVPYSSSSEGQITKSSEMTEYLPLSTSSSSSLSSSSSSSSTYKFFESSAERESTFRRRKEEILLSARQKYLNKIQLNGINDNIIRRV